MISHSVAALTREISCSTLEINLVRISAHYVLFSMYFMGYNLLNFVKSYSKMHGDTNCTTKDLIAGGNNRLPKIT